MENVHISNEILTDDVVNSLETVFEDPDPTVKRNNNKLFQFNIAFAILLLFGFIGCVFTKNFVCKSNIDWLEVILIFVGAIEYFFFMNIASKYIPVMPSYLPTVALDKINNL